MWLGSMVETSAAHRQMEDGRVYIISNLQIECTAKKGSIPPKGSTSTFEANISWILVCTWMISMVETNAAHCQMENG